MAISEIVDVQISIQDAAVERASFGIGLILGPSAGLTAKVEEFANQAAVLEVFLAGDPEAIMSAAYFGQDVKPEKVLIGKRDSDGSQSDIISIATLLDNNLYTLPISVEGGPIVNHEVTSDGDATREEIVDAFIIAINASSQVNLFQLVDNGENFTITSAIPGDSISYTGLDPNLLKTVVAPNTTIADEIAAIDQINSDWYALLSVSHVDKDIKRAANFIQSLRKIYVASSQNADIISPEKHIFTIDVDADFVTGNLIDFTIGGLAGTQTPFNGDHATTLSDFANNLQNHLAIESATTTGPRQISITAQNNDVLLTPFDLLAVTGGATQANISTTTIQDPTSDLGSELKALSLDRTALMYSAVADNQVPEAAWVGGRLPLDPGSQTWFAKTLRGVTVDTLTDSQKAKALGNNVNTYTTVGGVAITQNGTMASGRFIDIRRGIDALQADMEERVLTQVVNLPKIPYTDPGIAVVENQMRASLNFFVGTGLLAADPPFTISVPRVANIAQADRANRLLPDMKFTATLAGAIHKIVIRGTVSV